MQVFAAPDWFLQSLAVAPDGTLFAGTLYGGFYRSADRGLNWQSLAEGLPPDAKDATWVKALVPSPNFASDRTSLWAWIRASTAPPMGGKLAAGLGADSGR